MDIQDHVDRRAPSPAGQVGGGAGGRMPPTAFAEELSSAPEGRLVPSMALRAARLEAQLAATRAELDEHRARSEALERVQTDILRLASHELRTPLTVLNGYLSLITSGFFGPLPEPLTGVLGILERRTADMNALVNDMLVAARVEEAHIGAVAQPTDLRELLTAAVDAVRARASAAHTLVVSLPDRPVMVAVEADRLTLAMRNVVDNAVKYSPSGGEVACSLTVGDGRACVRVRDHGLGIAPEDRARLFTRFGRIVTTDNSHIPGIGLGLYFTREVARRNGGDIALAPDCDKGTMFELTLPLDGIRQA